MARLRYNGLTATLGAALASGDTTITLAAALTAASGAVPTISGGNTISLSILNAGGGVAEIVSLTAYTSGATTGTIARAQESTTAVAHASGATVVHSATVADFAATSSTGDAGWTAPTMVNGWVNYDATTGTPAGYRKDSNGRVWLRGLIKGGTVSAGTIFTLPAGYRPVAQQTFVVPINGSGSVAVGLIQVKADGSVVGLYNSTTYTYLDGVVFYTS